MRRRIEIYTAIGLRGDASKGVKDALFKYLKKDAERVGIEKPKGITKLTSEPEQLSFSEEVLQAGNIERKCAA